MTDHFETISLGIVSPQPRRLNIDIRFSKKNPFQDTKLPPIKGSSSNCDDEDRLMKELRLILCKPVSTLPPIGKKSPSPSLFPKCMPPSRAKANPIVKDEFFQDLNSTASTFVSNSEDA